MLMLDKQKNNTKKIRFFFFKLYLGIIQIYEIERKQKNEQKHTHV